MQNQEVIFIQVGSNIGVMENDPLSPFILRDNWKGVLIEPVPTIFEKLKKNYAGRPNLYFENVAISNRRGKSKFYTITKTDESKTFWANQVGSLDLSHALKYQPAGSELKAIEVDCFTLQDIVDKYKFNRIDVLHIDAEGYDDVILLSIDFKKIQPKFIIFEHYNMTFERYLACTAYLSSHGYSVLYTTLFDTVATL